MRNTLPAMSYVQTALVSLAGQIGVGVEGSNATVQGDDKWHSNSGNNLAVPPMDPYGAATRYFDVFSRGTKSCAWSASPWQPWVKLSQYSGTVGPGGAGDARVLISIDWPSVPADLGTTTVNINVTTPCRDLDKYGYPGQMVQVPVTTRRLPATFSGGFVEADGHVAIEGIHYSAIVPATSSSSSSSTAGGNNTLTYHTFRNYGRTSGGVGLWPLNAEKQTVATAPALDYSLYLFSNTTAANVTLYITPAHNYLSDYDPLQYAVALFPAGSTAPANPTVVRPVGDTVGANLPPQWGFAVADAVWGVNSGNQTTSRHAVAREGAYTLRVWCLLPGIVIQKVVVDLGGVRPSYLGPPESFYVDGAGGAVAAGNMYNGTSFLNGRGVL